MPHNKFHWSLSTVNDRLMRYPMEKRSQLMAKTTGVKPLTLKERIMDLQFNLMQLQGICQENLAMAGSLHTHFYLQQFFGLAKSSLALLAKPTRSTAELTIKFENQLPIMGRVWAIAQKMPLTLTPTVKESLGQTIGKIDLGINQIGDYLRNERTAHASVLPPAATITTTKKYIPSKLSAVEYYSEEPEVIDVLNSISSDEQGSPSSSDQSSTMDLSEDEAVAEPSFILVQQLLSNITQDHPDLTAKIAPLISLLDTTYNNFIQMITAATNIDNWINTIYENLQDFGDAICEISDETIKIELLDNFDTLNLEVEAYVEEILSPPSPDLNLSAKPTPPNSPTIKNPFSINS